MTIQSGNELIDPAFVLKKAELKPGSRIADLGCGGIGHFILPAAQMVGDSGMAFAVDVQKSVLENVATRARQENITHIKTVWSDLEIEGATKIKVESLDIALLINVLFQSDNKKAMIKEALRLLKKGGTLLIIDWLPESASFGPEPARRVNQAELQTTCESLGLKLAEEFEPGMYHFGLVYKK